MYVEVKINKYVHLSQKFWYKVWLEKRSHPLSPKLTNEKRINLMTISNILHIQSRFAIFCYQHSVSYYSLNKYVLGIQKCNLPFSLSEETLLHRSSIKIPILVTKMANFSYHPVWKPNMYFQMQSFE